MMAGRPDFAFGSSLSSARAAAARCIGATCAETSASPAVIKSALTSCSHSAKLCEEISSPSAALRRSLALSQALMMSSSPRLKKPKFAADIGWGWLLRKTRGVGAAIEAIHALSLVPRHAKHSHGHPHSVRLSRQYLPLA